MNQKGYRALQVWSKAMDLAVEANRLAALIPTRSGFSVADHLRGSAVSVPANIAEGNGRIHRREYAHHISIARGSLAEVETCLELAVRSGYLRDADVTQAAALAVHVGRMLNGLLATLRA
ncbi:MAG: four helix bundle protein [Gemmatimonadaceae bacterium]